MKEIELSKCRGSIYEGVALVDDDMYEELNKYNWYLAHNHRAVHVYRNATPEDRAEGYPKNIPIHRQVLGIKDLKIFIDHIDRNGLNNQRSNLRIATTSQNLINRPKPMVECSSIYKGVSLDKNKNKWRAYIGYRGKLYRLGYFKDEVKAALAYNSKAQELFGEFAYLNTIET